MLSGGYWCGATRTAVPSGPKRGPPVERVDEFGAPTSALDRPMSSGVSPARCALSRGALSRHPANVEVPACDPARLTPAVVHLGAGAFHRAHQAVYFDELAARGCTAWGVPGVGSRVPTSRPPSSGRT